MTRSPSDPVKPAQGFAPESRQAENLRALVACECSGIFRDALIALGVKAMSCDLEETERPGPHYKGDVRDVLSARWRPADCSSRLPLSREQRRALAIQRPDPLGQNGGRRGVFPSVRLCRAYSAPGSREPDHA